MKNGSKRVEDEKCLFCVAGGFNFELLLKNHLLIQHIQI